MAQSKPKLTALQRVNRRIKNLGDNNPVKKEQLIQRRRALQRRQGIKVLSNPNAVLSGRNMRFAAGALAKLINKSGIDSQRQLIKSIGQETARDTGKMEAMGGRLKGEIGALGNKMDEYGREAYDQSVATGDKLQENLKQNSNQAINRINQLQESVLGQQISSLQGANVTPGSSGSNQMMAQFAQAQQQAAANNAASWGNYGAAAAAGNTANVAAGTTAAKNSLNNKAIDIQRNITTRVADRMFEGSQAKQEAMAKLATLKSLRGAELVNQLMKLRGTERQFINDRQANALEKLALEIQARGDRADRALKKYEIDQDNANSGSSSSSGSDSGDNDDVTLSPAEWKQYRDAAKQHLGGGKVDNWKTFFDNVAKIEGVNWTPTERRKFAKKFKDLYFQQ